MEGVGLVKMRCALGIRIVFMVGSLAPWDGVCLASCLVVLP